MYWQTLCLSYNIVQSTLNCLEYCKFLSLSLVSEENSSVLATVNTWLMGLPCINLRRCLLFLIQCINSQMYDLFCIFLLYFLYLYITEKNIIFVTRHAFLYHYFIRFHFVLLLSSPFLCVHLHASSSFSIFVFPVYVV